MSCSINRNLSLHASRIEQGLNGKPTEACDENSNTGPRNDLVEAEACGENTSLGQKNEAPLVSQLETYLFTKNDDPNAAFDYGFVWDKLEKIGAKYFSTRENFMRDFYNLYEINFQAMEAIPNSRSFDNVRVSLSFTFSTFIKNAILSIQDQTSRNVVWYEVVKACPDQWKSPELAAVKSLELKPSMSEEDLEEFRRGRTLAQSEGPKLPICKWQHICDTLDRCSRTYFFGEEARKNGRVLPNELEAKVFAHTDVTTVFRVTHEEFLAERLRKTIEQSAYQHIAFGRLGVFFLQEDVFYPGFAEEHNLICSRILGRKDTATSYSSLELLPYLNASEVILSGDFTITKIAAQALEGSRTLKTTKLSIFGSGSSTNSVSTDRVITFLKSYPCLRTLSVANSVYLNSKLVPTLRRSKVTSLSLRYADCLVTKVPFKRFLKASKLRNLHIGDTKGLSLEMVNLLLRANTIESLNISGVANSPRFTEDRYQELIHDSSTTLVENTSLKKLLVAKLAIDPRVLLPLLSRCKSLTSLSIEEVRLTSADLTNIPPLESVTHVSILDVQCSVSVDLESFFRLFPNAVSFEFTDLSRSRLFSYELLDPNVENENVEEIDISSGGINMNTLGILLKRFPGLKNVNASNNNLSIQNQGTVPAHLRSVRFPTVESLNLSISKIQVTPEFIEDVFSIFKSLVSLNLSNNEFDDSDLFANFGVFSELEVLELDNYLCDQNRVDDIFRMAPNLRKLSLSNISVPYEQRSHLINGENFGEIQTNNGTLVRTDLQLEEVNLDGHLLTNVGLLRILHCCPRLKKISLRDNNVIVPGAGMLRQSITFEEIGFFRAQHPDVTFVI